jgi:hypothetical protein
METTPDEWGRETALVIISVVTEVTTFMCDGGVFGPGEPFRAGLPIPQSTR